MSFTPVEKEAIYRYLSKKVSLFSTFQNTTLHQIALEVIPMTFAPGSVIFKQDQDIAEMFYIIFQGTVEQKVDPANSEEVESIRKGSVDGGIGHESSQTDNN